MARDNSVLGVDRRTWMKGLGALGLAAAAGESASASTVQKPDRHGPYRNNRFLVEIDGIAKAGFSRVELPDAAISDVEYREGNDRHSSRRLKGSNEYDPLVLGAGVTSDSIELYEWFQQAEQGKVDDARKAIAVVLLDEEGEPGPRWEFRDAWPGRYDAPDLDATGNEVAIESLEILHEGMERVE